MPVLSFDDVSVTYATAGGSVPAVRGVSLSLDEGKVLGLAGESGCGKSTLASTVLRLQPDSAVVSGTVRLLGADVSTLRWSELRAVRWKQASMVFQGALHSLNPVRTIGRQIAEPILVHEKVSDAEAAERVGDLLEQVRLPRHRANAYPHQLSGGQKQRVMIAMALACRPRVIIADEPTTALDVMVQAQVLALITELVRETGVGLMVISHDLSVLADVCDDVAVMYAGRVVEYGPASKVFTSPAHPYARALSSAFPTIGDPASRLAPSGLAGDPPDPADLPPGCPFAPRCPDAQDACSEAEPHLRQIGATSAACILAGTHE